MHSGKGGGAAAATAPEATATDSSADAATDAPGGPGATGDEAAAAPAVTSLAKADAGATVATTAEAEAEAPPPPAGLGSAHCGSNAAPEVASTIEGLIVNPGGAKKALRRFVASFDTIAVEHGEWGTCVPCRSYRNLKCLFEFAEMQQQLMGR